MALERKVKGSRVAAFFPPRNNVTPQMKAGRNYTEETLAYMPYAVIADQITKLMVETLYGGQRFLLVETNGGIGGNTISFASNPKVGLVITREIRDERRLMLTRNVTAYGLGKKVSVIDGGFDGPDMNGSDGFALYFDPPWLAPEEDWKTSRNYLLSGITVGGITDVEGKVTSMTIEEWLAFYRYNPDPSQSNGAAYAFIAQMPPGYVMNAVEGWDIKHHDTADKTTRTVRSRLYYGTQKAAASFITSNTGGLAPFEEILKDPTNPFLDEEGRSANPLLTRWEDPYPEPVQEPVLIPAAGREPFPLKERKGPPPGRESGDRPPFARDVMRHAPEPGAAEEKPPVEAKVRAKAFDWHGFCQTLPDASQEKGSAEWMQEFRLYLQALLTVAVKPDLVEKMLDLEGMKIWAQAFTHESYNPNFNYETLETEGDAMLSYVFKRYLVQRFPKVTSQALSEYKAQYMSKPFMRDFSNEMKLTQWVLVNEVEAAFNPSIAEDVFEAFFGALDVLSDRIVNGLSLINSFNYMKLMFDRTEFDPKMIRGTPKTVLDQYGSKLGLGNNAVPAETRMNEQGYFETAIKLVPAFIEFLKQRRFNIKNPIAAGAGTSKKEAEAKAYANALATFESVGITWDWVGDQRYLRMFANLDQKLVEAARAKAKAAGFGRIEFFKSRTLAGVNMVTIQLRGLNALTGALQVLTSIRGSNKDEQALNTKLLQQYVSQG